MVFADANNFDAIEPITKDCIQYVIDNVDDFVFRFDYSTGEAHRRNKSTLFDVDEQLVSEIEDAVFGYLERNGTEFDRDSVLLKTGLIFGY
jgi:hypothetical protein